MRVLIVDDEDDIRRIASLSLSRVGGMEVTDVASGAAAIASAMANPPDAVLLDVMMPVLDGPGTLAALRADPKTSGVPIVFLTAKAMQPEVERLKALGAQGVLTKPFDPMKLPDLLRGILAGP
jgi:two-component system OmpR family response regulator